MSVSKTILRCLLPLAAVATAAATPPEPRPQLAIEGPTAGYGGAVVAGVGARLVAADLPPASRVLLDGAAVEPGVVVDGASGRREAVVETILDPGTPATMLVFLYDPESPLVTWEDGGLDLLDRYGLDQGEEPEPPSLWTRTDRDLRWLWSADGRRWLPLLPPGEDEASWEVLSDAPQVFLWDRSAPRDLRLRRLIAEDAISAVGRLDLVVRREPGGFRIDVAAVDLVGNRADAGWTVPSRRGRGAR